MLPLTSNDREAIIEHFLTRYRKTLEPNQRAALLSKADAGMPLYLLAALEELRTLGTFEEITSRITELPPTTQGLFTWISKRLENDDGFRDAGGRQIGKDLVCHFFELLAASRNGLSQHELADLIIGGDPLGDIAALLQLLRPYLMRRGDLLDFYHGQFRTAATELYLNTKAERLSAHSQLVRYFRDQGYVCQRTLEQLPHHLYECGRASGNYHSLFELLDTRDEFVDRKWSHFARFDLIEEDLDLGLKAARQADQLVPATAITVRGSTMRGLAFMGDHAETILAGTSPAHRDRLIRQMESVAMAETDTLIRATSLLRLGLAIPDDDLYDRFLQRLRPRLAYWSGRGMLSADHEHAFQAVLSCRGPQFAFEEVLLHLSQVQSPRILFSGLRLIAGSGRDIPSLALKRVGTLFWECVQRVDTQINPAASTDLDDVFGTSRRDSPWIPEFLPAEIWLDRPVSYNDVLDQFDRFTGDDLAALLAHTPQMTLPEPRSADLRNNASALSSVSTTDAFSGALHTSEPPFSKMAVRLTVLESILGTSGGTESSTESGNEREPFGTDEANRFFKTAVRLPDETDFLEACEKFCRGDWMELAQRLAGVKAPSAVRENFRDSHEGQRRGLCFLHALEQLQIQPAPARLKLQISLLVRRWGAQVAVDKVLEQTLDEELQQIGVPGISVVIDKWLLAPHYESGAERTGSLGNDEAARQIARLLRTVPDVVPEWFRLAVITHVFRSLSRSPAGFPIQDILASMLDLLYEVSAGVEKDLRLIEIAAWGAATGMGCESDSFFWAFRELAVKLAQHNDLSPTATRCLQALSRSSALVRRNIEVLTEITTRYWVGKAATGFEGYREALSGLMAEAGSPNATQSAATLPGTDRTSFRAPDTEPVGTNSGTENDFANLFSSIYDNRESGRQLLQGLSPLDFAPDGSPDWAFTRVQISDKFDGMPHPLGALRRRLWDRIPHSLNSLEPGERTQRVAQILDACRDSSDPLDQRAAATAILSNRVRPLLAAETVSQWTVPAIRFLEDYARYDPATVHPTDLLSTLILPILSSVSHQEAGRLFNRLSDGIAEANCEVRAIRAELLSHLLAVMPAADVYPSMKLLDAALNELPGDEYYTRSTLRIEQIRFLSSRLGGFADSAFLEPMVTDIDGLENDFDRFLCIHHLCLVLSGTAALSNTLADRLVTTLLRPALLIGTERLRIPACQEAFTLAALTRNRKAGSRLLEFFEGLQTVKSEQGDCTLLDADLAAAIRALACMRGCASQSRTLPRKIDHLMQSLEKGISTPGFKLLALAEQLQDQTMEKSAVQHVLDKIDDLRRSYGEEIEGTPTVWSAISVSRHRSRQPIAPHAGLTGSYARQVLELRQQWPVTAFLVADSLPDEWLADDSNAASLLRAELFRGISVERRSDAIVASLCLSGAKLCEQMYWIEQVESPSDRAYLYRMLTRFLPPNETAGLHDWFHGQLEYWSRVAPSHSLKGLAALLRLADRWRLGISLEPLALRLWEHAIDAPRQFGMVSVFRLPELLKVICGLGTGSKAGAAS